MNDYKLINRDQMEPSILRGKLDLWKPSKSDRAKPCDMLLENPEKFGKTLKDPKFSGTDPKYIE